MILLPLLEPPSFLKRLNDTVFPITSRLKLECTFTGAPKLFVTWYKDGKQLYASYRYNTKVTENSSILECLHECNEETPGKYSCEVSNSYGTDICHANVTTVTGSYNFGSFQFSTTIFYQPCDNTFMFSHLLWISIIWIRFLAFKHWLPKTFMDNMLKIQQCLQRWSEYSGCQFSIFIQSNNYDLLTVLFLSDYAQLGETLKYVNIAMNKKLKLECTFTGAPNVFVTWYKDSKQIYASYKHHTRVVGNSCMLESLHEWTKDTLETYSCQVSNSYGTDMTWQYSGAVISTAASQQECSGFESAVRLEALDVPAQATSRCTSFPQPKDRSIG